MSSFAIFERHNAEWARLAESAERYYNPDPNVCLVKLRQLAEQIVLDLIDRHCLSYHGEESNFFRNTKRLEEECLLPPYVANYLHTLRKVGNDAVHKLYGDHSEAANQLQHMYRVMMWYEGMYGDGEARAKFELPAPPRGLDEVTLAKIEALEALERKLEASEEARLQYEAQIAEQAEQLARPRVVMHTTLIERFNALEPEERLELEPKVQAYRRDPESVEISPFAQSSFGWVPLIDDPYGLAVAPGPKGDVIVCAWLGTEQECRRWAAQRYAEVHPQLGTLQIFDTQVEVSDSGTEPLFALFDDDDLLSVGLPERLLPSVRALSDRDSLDQLAPHLPAEAAETLVALVGGSNVEQAREQAGLQEISREPIDTQDFDVALGHVASQRSFADVDDEELRALLLAPMEQWRVFLHPSQERAVYVDAAGPVRVLGGAGTGKTVALMHRAVHLVSDVFREPEARVLVTTYTRNLAAELEHNIAKLALSTDMARLDVANLHRVAAELLRQRGQHLELASRDEQQVCWEQAFAVHDLEFEEGFYREEWEHVVQAQGLIAQAHYVEASRRGRGSRLGRNQRERVWRVLADYRASLDAMGKHEWPDLMRLSREAVEADSSLQRWVALLSDEVQDYTPSDLAFLRALIPEGPNDLFLVGDSHQRIYGRAASFRASGIAIVGRSYRLKVNYRTTSRISRLATSVIEALAFDDMDGALDTLEGYHSLRLGVEPTIVMCDSIWRERDAIVEQLHVWLNDQGSALEEICLAARTNWQLKLYIEALEREDFAYQMVSSDVPLEELGPGVRVATMHRLKGTEFKRVILAGVQRGQMPYEPKGGHANASLEEALRTERALFYVAATRARDDLVITGHGEPSPFLTGLMR